MKKPTRRYLRTWRPLLSQVEVRTHWNGRAWITQQSWQGKIIFAEQLPLSRWARPLRVATEELHAVCTAAPHLGPGGVYSDTDGNWLVRIPCTDCGSFVWPLPMRNEYKGGLRGEWETAVVRLLAYRAVEHFREDACPSCFERRVLEDDPALQGENFYWFSIAYQDWYVRIAKGEQQQDLPLYLPAWSDEGDVRRKAEAVARGGAPFDWEKS